MQCRSVCYECWGQCSINRLYTQNIDSLERKVGVDEADLIECHGTTLRAKCDECRKVSSREDPSEKSRRASETHVKVATCYIVAT